MDRRHSRRVRSLKPHLGSPQPIARRIRDPGPPSRHDSSTRDYLSVHLERPGKVPGSKGGGDIAHVVSDRGDPRRIRSTACVEDDAPTILKVLEDVGRRILIDAHDHLTACLHSREGSDGPARAGVSPAPARGECEHKGNRRDPPSTRISLRREEKPYRQRFISFVTDVEKWVHSQAPLFLSSQTFGSQSSILFSSGSMIHANLPFSCDSGPWMTSTPPARSCSSSSPRLSTR